MNLKWIYVRTANHKNSSRSWRISRRRLTEPKLPPSPGGIITYVQCYGEKRYESLTIWRVRSTELPILASSISRVFATIISSSRCGIKAEAYNEPHHAVTSRGAPQEIFCKTLRAQQLLAVLPWIGRYQDDGQSGDQQYSTSIHP